MKVRCICGYESDTIQDGLGDLLYHIDTSQEHKDKSKHQLYELLMQINTLIHGLQIRHDKEGLIATEKSLEDVALLLWSYKDWELEQAEHRTSLTKKQDLKSE